MTVQGRKRSIVKKCGVSMISRVSVDVAHLVTCGLRGFILNGRNPELGGEVEEKMVTVNEAGQEENSV